MIPRNAAWVVVALILTVPNASGALQEGEKPAQERFDALVNAWSDVRFWIYSHGERTGWQRYQVRWGEYEGEKMVVVDYDRATSLHSGDRFTAWLKPNAFLSPRAVRWADCWFELRIEKGKIGDFGKAAPENLTIFPELLAALRLPKEEAELGFSLLLPGGHEAGPGKLEGKGEEKAPGSPKEAGPAQKIKMTAKLAGFTEGTLEASMWFRGDRALARLRSTLAYQGFEGRKVRELEELVPVGAKEWNQEDVVLNEIRAAAQLKQLAALVAHFRSYDVDGNQINDYWTGDVSGLYRLVPPKRKNPMGLISMEMALADASPLPAGPEKGGATISEALGPKPAPLYGYFFKALEKGRVRREPSPLNDGSNRNADMYGFCAYPAEYGKTGRRTYFITEDNNPYWKDLKGQPISESPVDALKEGWQWAGVRK